MSENYFQDSEFKCKCGRVECDAITKPHPALLLKLNVMRMLLNYPVFISSGIRCKYYNEKVKGVKNSQHITGEAVDVAAVGSRPRFEMVEAALKAGFKRIGVGKTFVHVDVGVDADQRVLWLYD